MQTMIATARSFRAAGDRCFQTLSGGHYDARMLCAPAIVCYAFSLEIYLKFLLKNEGKEIKKTHDLANLYNRLSESLRREIEGKVGDDNQVFQNNLKSFGKAFEEWRCQYEDGSAKPASIGFASKLIAALEAIAEDRGFRYPSTWALNTDDEIKKA
jgi:HEPN domain-containing protein